MCPEFEPVIKRILEVKLYGTHQFLEQVVIQILTG